MKLRIVSDGTGHGTTVETDAGEIISGVTKVQWQVEAGGRATVKLELRDTEIDAFGEQDDEEEQK